MHYNEFKRELEILLETTQDGISNIMLSDDRISKHMPYSWMKEDPEGHFLKAARHILTYLNIQGGHQVDTGENHLDNAITRLAMGLYITSQNDNK